jgi:S-DNA-T family DNA segregation ATPase FtsK/SpoIIIE
MVTSLNGRLFLRQIRTLRGLRVRLAKLRQSRLADQGVLESKKAVASRNFSERQNQLRMEQFRNWRAAITEWDTQIEKQTAIAERETLEILNFEKQQTKKLKTDFVQDKARAKSEQESATKLLKQKLEEAQSVLNQSKANVVSKLEVQRSSIEQQMHECREWVGIRTGVVGLQNLQAGDASEVVQQVSTLTDLNQVAKQFEEAKKALVRDIERMRSHPVTKLLGSYLFLGMGLVLGGIASAIAWSIQPEILIVAIVGGLSSIVFTAIIYFVAAPLVMRTIRRMFPYVVDQEQRANLILVQGRRIAESNYQVELGKLTKAHLENEQRLEAEYREKRTKLVESFNTQSAQLLVNCRQDREKFAAKRRDQHERINMKHTPVAEILAKQQKSEQQQLFQDHEEYFAKLQGEFEKSQRLIVERWTSGCQRTSEWMKTILEQADELYPDWSSTCYSEGNWPRVAESLAWKLGEINPQALLAKAVHDLHLGTPDHARPWPVFYDLLSHGGLVLETHAECKADADRMVRNTLLRAITSVPAGNLNVTIIDPEGLGKQFSWLMSLADIDPVLVNHRAWTQPLHIAEQLTLAARHVEDVIQQSLRDRFANLIEYNRIAGPMAVPYRLLVWSNFPSGLDDHAWQSLCSILSSGGKCGVGVILQVSDSYVWPSFADKSKLKEFGLRLCFEPSDSVQAASGRAKTRITIDQPELANVELTPELPPADDRIQEIMGHQAAALSNLGKRVVPFETIALPILEQGTASSAEGLSIPLGVSDAGRTQLMKLGAGTAQHVLIAGKTGSGKSSLLHTMITSAVMKYSPDQLRLVLLDFKKGVEFQVYSESAISHADIIGIESKREFGVSTLEYLDRILNARGEAFRQWGVQDLPSLAKKFPQHALPRILVLIDEFQELFVEDDKLSQQASMLMDRIVRQGRSFGMHLVLASQTLGGAYSLPRTTLSQMAVRIALHCDSSDAMLILSEDNTAAERLRHSGQAIYNEAGGRFESNHNFQVAYIEKSDQLERLGKLEKSPIPLSPTTNPLGRQIVFEGHKPAKWDDAILAKGLSDTRQEQGMWPIFLGESVSIDPPVIKSLTRAAGRNMMIVGQDEATAASLLAGAVAGHAYIHSANPPSMILLDGTRNEDTTFKKLLATLSNLNLPIQVTDVRSIDATMLSLQQELDRRNAVPEESFAPMLIAIANLSRFRELRRSEEYSFGEASSGPVKPDSVLANLLRDGPPLGMYVWIWADSASSISRWVSRQSLRDMELRILMQMSATDSNQLIDSNAANRLDRYVALVHDDIEGKVTKFRPFELESILAGNWK